MADPAEDVIRQVEAQLAKEGVAFTKSEGGEPKPKRGRPKKGEPEGTRSRKKTPVMGTPALVAEAPAKRGPGRPKSVGNDQVAAVLKEVVSKPARVKKIDPKDCPKPEAPKRTPRATTPTAVKQAIKAKGRKVKDNVDDFVNSMSTLLGRVRVSKKYCK